MINLKSKLEILAVATVLVASCAPEQIYDNKKTPSTQEPEYIDETKATGHYAYAEISVPVGTKAVMVETYALDAEGNRINVKTQRVEVTPQIMAPKGGKDVEPFGRVRLLLKAPTKTLASVYYTVSGDVTDVKTDVKSDDEDDRTLEAVYTINDLPLDQNIIGQLGKTRYVQCPWSFAYTQDENWQPVETRPKDVVIYDEEHNHTLRYKFVYTQNNGFGYFLDDAYIIEDYRLKGEKYHYCAACSNCPYCMPWGCSCGCGGVNPDFVPSGDTTGGAQAPAAGEDPIPVPTDVTEVYLTEPASYVTHDTDKTNYHSSGTVMFEDSWPNHSLGGPFDADFNDVVIDYDIEARTVADNILEAEGWREQVKAVIHVRALGSTIPWRVGLVLENFNMDYVQNIVEYKTLDSYNSGHGELPTWTIGTLQENSLHYDPLAKQYATSVNTRPAIEIGGLQRLHDAAAGTETYIYTNNGKSEEHVMNPALKRYAAWGDGPHTDQYSPSLETDTTLPVSFASIQNSSYYNAVPGYVNTSGGLYTYTVVYEMKPRADMTPEQREAVKQNMIDAVVNTNYQNFYIVKQDYSPVGLKGYAPVDFSVKNYSNYAEKYQQVLSQNLDKLDESTYYMGKNGEVWAFKCPTLTKHVWDKLYFSRAYPHFEEWVTSNGAQYPDWYLTDVNGDYLTCWW